MAHRIQVHIGTTRAIAICSCGWNSPEFPKDKVQEARDAAADHIIDRLAQGGARIVQKPKT